MFSRIQIGMLWFTLVIGFAKVTFGLYTNPLIDSNHPDPGVLKIDGGYVAVSTSNYATENEDPAFPILFSTDLVHWEERGHVFPAGGWPDWAYMDMWAPEIHFVDDCFYVYFSGRQRSGNNLAIGVAIAQDRLNPFGPYQDYGHPIIEGNPGVIDIHYFQDPRDNVPYLVWKIENFVIDQPSQLFIQPVESNGIDFIPGSEPTLILESTQPSDVNVVEGPSIIYREPYYYLIFSADGFLSSYYHCSVARALQVSGPYERSPEDQLFLQTDLARFDAGENSTFVGPGHGTPVQAPDGTWVYVYHTWRYERVGQDPPGRVMNMDVIHFGDDGWPMVGHPSDTEQLYP